MKKALLLSLVVMLTAATFTSCKKDTDLQLKDLAGYTFEGEDADKYVYTLKFESAAQAFTFTSTLPFATAGTYTINGTSVILAYTGSTTTETLQSDGVTKLIYTLTDGEKVVLKRK